MQLAKTIVERREKLGLSQEAAARLANVSAQTWHRWEHGTMPQSRQLEGIAAALGTTVGKLVK